MIFTEFEMIMFFFLYSVNRSKFGCHGFLFNMSLDFSLTVLYLEFISLTTEKNCPVLFSLCNDLEVNLGYQVYIGLMK